MSQFEYITHDFWNMTSEERDPIVIRSGPIDFRRLYACAYGTDSIPSEGVAALKGGLRHACENKALTRCQLDLLQAEFGKDEINFGDAITAGDSLTSEPLSANVKKLKVAIETIKYAAHKS